MVSTPTHSLSLKAKKAVHCSSSFLSNSVQAFTKLSLEVAVPLNSDKSFEINFVTSSISFSLAFLISILILFLPPLF